MIGVYIPGMDADEYNELCEWARIGSNNAMIGRKPCVAARDIDPTNADRIRAMTDDELAEWIANDLIEPGYDTYERTYRVWLEWLKSPVWR